MEALVDRKLSRTTVTESSLISLKAQLKAFYKVGGMEGISAARILGINATTNTNGNPVLRDTAKKLLQKLHDDGEIFITIKRNSNNCIEEIKVYPRSDSSEA